MHWAFGFFLHIILIQVKIILLKLKKKGQDPSDCKTQIQTSGISVNSFCWDFPTPRIKPTVFLTLSPHPNPAPPLLLLLHPHWVTGISRLPLTLLCWSKSWSLPWKTFLFFPYLTEFHLSFKTCFKVGLPLPCISGHFQALLGSFPLCYTAPKTLFILN